jgi:V/A-type H+/Na+-transporting ATPase subunit E
MDNKLQVLTEKLYNEGVAKGLAEAEKIVAEAKVEAATLLRKAQADSEGIISEAQKRVADLDKNTRSELQLASKQVVNSLMQEVANLIDGAIVTTSIKEATTDSAFMQNLILTAVTSWVEKQDLTVIVSEKDKEALTDFFANKAKSLLDKGLTIESANQIKAGFQIGPADGSYKVSFTESDFINFFKEFLRPKVVELLFGQK